MPGESDFIPTPEYTENLLRTIQTYAYELRNEADRDYIGARHLYGLGLRQQFLWNSQQAIEKYLKCIPLLHNSHLPDKLQCSHDLGRLFEWMKDFFLKKRYPLSYPNWLPDYLATLSDFGLNRYALTGVYAFGYELEELDETVWTLRRYCAFFGDLVEQSQDIQHFIYLSTERPPLSFSHHYQGYLEQVLKEKEGGMLYPQRVALGMGNICLQNGAQFPARWSSSQEPFWLFDSVRPFITSNPDQILKDLSKRIYFEDNQRQSILELYRNSTLSPEKKKIRKVSSGNTKEEDWITCTPVCGNKKSQKYGFYGSRFWREVVDTNRISFNTEKEARDAGYKLAGNGKNPLRTIP